jgi:hypothetical protein
MVEGRSWMYSGWNKRGSYTDEWIDKATAFLDYAFSQTQIVRWPCSVPESEVLRGKENHCHTLV